MEKRTKVSDYEVIIFRGGKPKSTSDEENARLEDTGEKMNTEVATTLVENPKETEEPLHENKKSNSNT